MLVAKDSHELTADATPAAPLTREQIVKLQNAMLPMQCDQPEPRHFFAPGMYLRELTIPAGMLMVGKIHKHAHFLMVLKGRAEVISEFGRMVVEAGHISVSPPGVKRIVLALEEVQFATVHVNPTDTEDLTAIEAEHIEAEILGLTTPEGKGELK
jgi:mannose-6-phosphate isomerase-like protein (cupin superfamily)